MMTETIDLMLFCAEPDEIRPLLEKPWYDRGYNVTVATDGRMMVFVRGRHPQAIDRPEHMPAKRPAQQLAMYRPGERAALPELPEPLIESCDCCNASGKVHDEGESFDCPQCGGSGTWPKNRPITVGRSCYGEYYLRRLMALPGLQFEADPEPANTNCRPASFEFDGRWGLLMPLREEKEP
jgi:hypothetical protein